MAAKFTFKFTHINVNENNVLVNYILKILAYTSSEKNNILNTTYI